MSDFLSYAEQFKVKESEAVKLFIKQLEKQVKAIDTDNLNRRSWAKKDGTMYIITLGKLDGTYALPDKGGATQFLGRAAHGARYDEAFIKKIEAAYGTPKRKRSDPLGDGGKRALDL